MDNKKIKKFLSPITYDNYGQMLWANQQNDAQLVCELRGWGKIQNMFDNIDDAILFQDDVGQFIADAINEKLKTI